LRPCRSPCSNPGPRDRLHGFEVLFKKEKTLSKRFGPCAIDNGGSMKRTINVLACIGILASFLFALSGPALAGEAEQEPVPSDRILKGHKFLRPYRFPLALPTTNVGVGLGYFYSSIKLDVDEDLFFVEQDTFHFGGLNESLTFEAAFLKRYSIEFQILGRAAVGADRDSALVFGGRFTFAASAVPKVNLIQNERTGTALSISMGVTYDRGAETSPVALLLQVYENARRYVRDSLESEDTPEVEDAEKIVRIDLAEALTDLTVVSIRPGLLFAQTLHRSVGVQASLRLDRNVVKRLDAPDVFGYDDNDPDTTLVAGTVLSFDLGAITPVHMGFRFLFDYENKRDDSYSFNNWITGAGIGYTGRKNLELGLIYFGRIFSGKIMDSTDQYLILNLRYYW